MASLGYVDTLWTPPSDQPWTIVQVTADDTGQPLHHYAFVYDGSGNLTVYRDKTADAPISHTPAAEPFKIDPQLYDDSETVAVYYAVTIDDTAFDQAAVDEDYELYFGSEPPQIGSLTWNGVDVQNFYVDGTKYDNVYIDGIKVIGD